jgi:hypothetical protein
MFQNSYEKEKLKASGSDGVLINLICFDEHLKSAEIIMIHAENLFLQINIQ